MTEAATQTEETDASTGGVQGGGDGSRVTASTQDEFALLKQRTHVRSVWLALGLAKSCMPPSKHSVSSAIHCAMTVSRALQETAVAYRGQAVNITHNTLKLRQVRLCLPTVYRSDMLADTAANALLDSCVHHRDWVLCRALPLGPQPRLSCVASPV